VKPAPHAGMAKVDGQLNRLLYEAAREAGLVESGPLNLGEPENFRVLDRTLLPPGPDAVYLPTAALVVEIVSPGDDTWEKLEFYAAHQVDELLIVDPEKRQVDWLTLTSGGECAPVERSWLIDLGPGELAEQLDWPK
jgi:hypothetical protein